MEFDIDKVGPYLFCAFPVLWYFMCLHMSQTCGWAEMARRWSAPSNVEVDKRYFRSGQVGSMKIGSAMVTGASKEGLYLALVLPFRPGHPPLLIPWSELSRKGREKIALLLHGEVLTTTRGQRVVFYGDELDELLSEADKLGADVKHLN